jgi:DNA-binding SARP family transcriptional activator
MGAELEIWLLGGFRVSVCSQPVAEAAWRLSKARTLVKLLALTQGHRMHREQLTDLLWPELDTAAGAANLRKALHYARHALSADLVVSDRDLVGLPPDRTWVDVDAFEAAAARCDNATANELYRGDLLPEDRFEDWAEHPRDRLRSRFGKLLQNQAADLSGRGDHQAAAEILERLSLADPLNEQLVAALMSAFAAAGQRHLALGWYRQLQQRLADELGVSPSPQLAKLRARIAAGRPTGPSPEESPPAQAAPTPAAERKLVTALLAEPFEETVDRDAEVARSERDTWLRLACGVLEAWGATAQPMVGSGVLAVFGLPAVHEDDIARALHAGLQLVDRLGPQVRICAATGEVIAPEGPATDPRDIVGEALDAVLQARTTARPGQIIASDRTCRGAGPGFKLETLNPGWHVVRAADTRDSPARLRGPIIGRDTELAMVTSLLDAVAQTASPRLLMVTGAAGVGKSRLVAEVIRAAQTRYPAAMVLQGRCVALGDDVTYIALSEILRQACGVSLGDPPERAQARLRTAVHGILDRLPPGADLDATVHALAVAAGIPLRTNRLDGLAPHQVQDELAQAWALFATGCAADNPAVLVIEDLHWASTALLDMVELIIARATGPVLVIGTARPDLAALRPGFGAGLEGVTSVALRPLPDGPSRTLLNRVIPSGDLPESRRRHLLDRAEGNPLFLEQLALHLDDSRDESLPDSLHGLLAARIDTVPEPARRVLQWAAAIGRVFWAQPLEQALPDLAVDDLLAELERRGIIAARTTRTLPGHADYAFRHILLREVAYASMPKATRARAHATIGRWLTGLAADDEGVAELLAHHFGEAAAGVGADLAWSDAGDRETIRASAFRHLLAAGDIARRRADVARAIELHTRAQALAHADDESVTAFEALAEDHQMAYHGDQASQCYLDALAIAGEPRVEARLCRKLALTMADTPGAFHINPEPTAVEDLVARGLRAAAGDEVETAWLLVVRGMSTKLWRDSEPFDQPTERRPVQLQIADVERAAGLGRRLGLPGLVSKADDALFVLHGIAGAYQDVLLLARRRLDDIDRARSRLERADTLRNAALSTMWIAGDYQEGRELATRAHELSIDTNPHQLMHATYPLLVTLFHLGHWSELPAILDQHLDAFTAEPALGCAFVRDGLAIAATMYAHRREFERAAAIAARLGDPLHDIDASAWQARYATASGNPVTAVRISRAKAREGRMYGPQHALALVDALVALQNWDELPDVLTAARAVSGGLALLAPHCDRAEGMAAVAAGRPQFATTRLRAALAAFERLNTPFEAACTGEHLAPLVGEREARHLLASARATRDRLGAPRLPPGAADEHLN